VRQRLHIILDSQRGDRAPAMKIGRSDQVGSANLSITSRSKNGRLRAWHHRQGQADEEGEGQMKIVRIINASFWLYVWLSDATQPVLTDGDFWTEKGKQLFRLNSHFNDPYRLIGNAVIPLALCLAIDWVLRKYTRNASRQDSEADDTTQSMHNILMPSGNQEQTADNSSKPLSKNLITRHWRGQFSLPVAYWIMGFLGGIFITIIMLFLSELLSPTFDFVPWRFLAVVVLAWTVIAAVSVWQCVGIWRSATRYRATRAKLNKGTLWAGLAKGAVVLGILGLLPTVIDQAIPQITEATKIALLGDPDMPSYQMRVMRDGTEIEITGGMKYGLSDDFQRVIAATPRLRVVHLNSVGGRIGEAEKLNRIIKEHGFTTYTSNSCVSACTIAFIAGHKRWLSNDAKLGFHKGAFAGMQMGFAENLLKSTGASQAFISHTLTTPSTSMWYPTMDELLTNKIITDVASSDIFAMSGYGPNISQYDLGAKFKTIPLYSAIAQSNPELFESLLNTLHASYIAGEPEGVAFNKMRQKFLPYIRSRLAFSDDATLMDYQKLIVEQYIVLRSLDPKLCFEYAAGASPNTNFSAYFPVALTDREAALDVRVIETANPAARAKPTDAELQPYQATIYRQLLTRFAKSTGM
jgi:hypothetical protein